MSKTVISNNCFGGLITRENGLPYCSPTVYLHILPEEFPKFCANLKHYMDAELVEYRDISEEHRRYLLHMYGYIPNHIPFGLVDDIIVVFQHYNTFDEAADAWNRRKVRVDYNDVRYLFHVKNDTYKDCAVQFIGLGLENSACLTEGFSLEGAHRFDVPENCLDCFGSVNGKRVIEQNFSIKQFLGL